MSYFYLIDGKPIESTKEILEGTPITREEFLSHLSAPPDWAGFRQWRRSNSEYKNLLRQEPGLVMTLESDIDRGDLVSATLIWAELKNLNSVSAILEEEITEALQTYNLTELQEALSNYNT